MRAAILFLALATSLVLAHQACQSVSDATFYSGTQHCDCDYTVPPGTNTSDAAEHENDLMWLNMVHQYAVTNMAKYPFGAAIVDSRNNSLVQIGFNNYFTADPYFSSTAMSHAETVVITNATLNNLKETFNATSLSRKVSQDWKYMVLYGNIEACPMCSQVAIWRGIRKMVFGARASVLAAERCWTQPTLTSAEVLDHSSSFAPFDFIRGPFEEIEMTIVNDFKQQCKTPTTTGGSTTASNAGRNAQSPFSSLMENVRALV